MYENGKQVRGYARKRISKLIDLKKFAHRYGSPSGNYDAMVQATISKEVEWENMGSRLRYRKGTTRQIPFYEEFWKHYKSERWMKYMRKHTNSVMRTREREFLSKAIHDPYMVSTIPHMRSRYKTYEDVWNYD